MNDNEVLQRVQAALETSAKGTFCFVCGRPNPKNIQTGLGQHFLCPAGHFSPRAYVFDGKAEFSYALPEQAAGTVRV